MLANSSSSSILKSARNDLEAGTVGRTPKPTAYCSIVLVLFDALCLFVYLHISSQLMETYLCTVLPAV